MKVYTVVVEKFSVGRVITDDSPSADTMQKLHNHIRECLPNYLAFCQRNNRSEDIELRHQSNETFDSMIQDKKQYRVR